MRIGIDLRDLSTGIVGIGKTTLNLLSYLAENPKEHEYFLYQFDDQEYVQGDRFHHIPARFLPYHYLKEQIYFGARSYLDDLDVFHSPIHLPPKVVTQKTKIVFTVHDLHSELDAQFFPTVMNRYFKEKRLQAIKSSDAVIVHSEYVKQKVLELTNVTEDKINLVSLNLDVGEYIQLDASKREDVKSIYQLPDKYFLYVGSHEPWKRVNELIKAFREVSQGSDWNLILIGRPGWDGAHNAEVDDLVSATDNVLKLGYVPQADLPAIYQNAQALVSASLWEGFGVIFKEAIAAGLPIIAANHAAIPEVVGDCGLLFDPYDFKSLQNLLRQMIEKENPREMFQEERIASLEKSQKQSYGEGIFNVYQKLF